MGDDLGREIEELEGEVQRETPLLVASGTRDLEREIRELEAELLSGAADRDFEAAVPRPTPDAAMDPRDAEILRLRAAVAELPDPRDAEILRLRAILAQRNAQEATTVVQTL